MNTTDFKTSDKETFYRYALQKIFSSEIPALVGGGYAFKQYTGLKRDTADLDIFCKAGDYPRLMKLFMEEDFPSGVEDERWIGKIYQAEGRDEHIDFIFNTVNGICAVDDLWFDHAQETTIFDTKVKLISPVEYIWGKIFMWDRYRYEGADVNHVILHEGQNLEWKHLLFRMEQHWQLLFSQILNFLFVYPSEREKIPQWLLDELSTRLQHQFELPIPETKVCRGPLISQTQYETEITEWGYKVLTYSTI